MVETGLEPDTSLEDLIQQFRLAAAEIQSAYHQLEQDLLMSGEEEPYEPVPAPSGLELPNLAPLHLMGSLVGGLSNAALVVNQNLEVVSANGEAQRESGLGRGTDLKAALTDQSAVRLQELIDEATSGSGVDLRLKSGGTAGTYDCIYLDNPIEKGRLLLLVVHELDLDQLRDVEDQILKNLTGTLVHEIRTPLTSMQGFAELLMQIQDLDPGESDKLQIIRLGIERLNLLATALGDVFNQPLEPHWMKIDLPSFLRAVVSDFTAAQSLPEDLIRLEAPSGKLQLVSDPELLRLALEQLLRNAVEAVEGDQAGDVQLALQEAAEEVTIAVRDRGPGAGEADTADWWVPFYTTKNGHLGLGLVQVRRILETLGGRAEIRSEERSGVEVALVLPL